MVIIFIIILATFGLEQEISSNELKYHARKAPYISSCVIAVTKDHFRRAILTGLNLACEVMEGPARIAQVTNIDSHILIDTPHCHSSLLSRLLATIRSLNGCGYNARCKLFRGFISDKKWVTGLCLFRSREGSFFLFIGFLELFLLSLFELLLFALLELLPLLLELCLIS